MISNVVVEKTCVVKQFAMHRNNMSRALRLADQQCVLLSIVLGIK